MTNNQILAMDRAGETGEVIFRDSPCTIDEVRFVEIANRHLPGDMDPHNAWLFFQEASRAFFGKEIA